MISAYLASSVVIVRYTLDQWGAPTVSSETTVKARVDAINKVVRDRSGKEVVSTATVTVQPDTDVLVTDKVILPGETEARQILSVRVLADFAPRSKEIHVA